MASGDRGIECAPRVQDLRQRILCVPHDRACPAFVTWLARDGTKHVIYIGGLQLSTTLTRVDAKWMFESRIRCVGPAFRPRTPLVMTPSNAAVLVAANVLLEKNIQVRDMRRISGHATIDFQGFELRHLPADMSITIRSLAACVDDSSEEARAWRHRDVTAYAVDAVVRRRSASAPAPIFHAIPLAHCDFPVYANAAGSDTFAKNLCGTGQEIPPLSSNAHQKTLVYFRDTWARFLPRRARIVGMVNVWMPLDAVVRHSHLGVVDKSTLAQKAHMGVDPLVMYTAQRRNGERFDAMALRSSTERWYSLFGMRRGDALLFDSVRTPHSAIALAGEPQGSRASVEVRMVFCR